MQLLIASTVYISDDTSHMIFSAKCRMKGLVLSDEEAVREKLFGFDEAMEVSSNTDVMHCALIRRFNLPIVRIS